MNGEIFDIDCLYFGDEYYSALKIITPIQDVSLYTFYHDDAAKNIYKSLYGSEMEDGYFGYLFNEMNAISIQMMCDNFNVIIMIPNINSEYVLNSFQLDKLYDFYLDMLNVNEKRDEPIELHTNVFDGKRHLDLGSALLFLKDKISDDIISNEIVLGSKSL